MTDVAMYHGDSGRTGLNSTFPFAPVAGAWYRYVTLPTNAPVRAAPLFLSEYTFSIGPHVGQIYDMVIVASSDNLVAAYAEEQLLAGVVKPLWVISLGTASTRRGGNILPPIGICGTPLIDRGSETLFAVALVHESSGDVFKAFALDLNTGTIQGQVPLQDPGAAGRPTFDPTTLDQRSGLNLVDGWLFATFAAFPAFDKGPYHGWVVAFKQTNLSQQLFLPVTKNVLGGGIWGPGGAAAATDGTLYVSTGNATNTSDSYWTPGKHPGDSSDYFEGVVRVQLTGNPGLKVIDWYQPTWARALNDTDQDFGGSSPIVLPRIGGRQLIVTTAKDGNAYLLDGTLPGWGGELWSSVTDPSKPADHALFRAGSKCAPAYYHDPVGDNDYVYVVGSGNPGLVAFKVDLSGLSPKLMHAWNAGLSFGHAPGSPFVIADPTTQKALVWVVDPEDSPNAVLRAFDAVSGELMFRSDAVPNNGPGTLPHFAPITGAGKSILVGTNTGVVGYMNLPPALSVILDQSAYVQSEVKIQLPGIVWFAAGWVKLDGFRPSDLGLNHGNLSNPPASSIPTFSIALDLSLPSVVDSAIGGMLAPPIFAPPVVPGDPNLPDAPQSFLFPFTLTFKDDTGFIAMRNASPPISSTTVMLTTRLFSLSDSAPIELTTGEAHVSPSEQRLPDSAGQSLL